MLCVALRTSWPRRLRDYGHIAVAGLLVQSLYLIGVYCGIYLGVSIGVMALIVGLQPLITGALVGPFLRESVSRLQWLGLALGFGGLSLVVAERVVLGDAVWFGYALGLIGLVAITTGTLYQKKFCATFDLRTTVAIQNTVSCVVILALAGPVRDHGGIVDRRVPVRSPVVGSGPLGHLHDCPSTALVTRGAATRGTSLIYLSPPTTAAMGWLFFGESLAVLAIVGMMIAVVGVAMVSRGSR